MRSDRSEDQAGMTLIELTVALALLGVFLVAALGTFASGWRGAADLDRETVRQAEARAAMDTLVADLRQAHTGDTALPPVTAVSTRAITFHSPDRAQPHHIRRIRYRVTGTVLERSVTTSTNTGAPPWTFPAEGRWVPVADGVQAGTIFTARDATGAATTTAAAVRRVEIALAVDIGRAQNATARQWDVTVDLRSGS